MNATSGKELLFSVTADDCDWMFFGAGGKGGQNVDRRATACRCRHKASGAEGISRDERSQWQNKKAAFSRMAETQVFKTWLKLETGRQLLTTEERRKQETPEQVVDRMMSPENLKIEVKEDGKWVEMLKAPDDSE